MAKYPDSLKISRSDGIEDVYNGPDPEVCGVYDGPDPEPIECVYNGPDPDPIFRSPAAEAIQKGADAVKDIANKIKR